MASGHRRFAAAMGYVWASLICIAWPDHASATVRRVPSQYPTIRAGVQAAVNGDTVLVAPGTYEGERDIDFLGRQIVLVSEGGPSVTIIPVNSWNSAFDLHSGEPPTTVIRGFTIRDAMCAIRCYASSPTVIDCVFRNNNGDNAGGAVWCRDGSAPTLVDCEFNNNLIDGGYFGARGGAIYSEDSSLTLRDCSFADNLIYSITSSAGGAIYCEGGSLTMSGCTFTGNVATSWSQPPACQAGSGGALAVLCAGSVVDCVFTGNRAEADLYCTALSAGGAMVVDGSVVFTNCDFAGNSSGGEGGAVAASGSTRFEQCMFSGNRALLGNGGVVYVQSGTPSFERCTFSGNTAWGVGGVAVAVGQSTHPSFSRCLFLRNSARLGGVLSIAWSYATLANCTLFENAATDTAGGGAVYIDTTGPVSRATIENTIVAFGTSGGTVTCRGECCFVTMSCTDLFGNAGGDYVDCVSGFLGVDGNISADPEFCDAAAGDFALNAASPCAPANAPPGCGLIGAFDVACGQLGIEVNGTALGRPVVTVAPNPLWSEAQLTVRGMRPGSVVEIVDAGGRVIDALRPEASGVVRWHPSRELPSGVYFARVREEDVGSTRFVLIR